MAARFEGRLVLEALDQPDGRGRQVYRLLEPLTFHSDVLGRELCAPAGLETDFASIPWPVQLLMDDDSPFLLRASVIHDWLYRGGGAASGVTRRQADQVLGEAMSVCGAGPALRRVVQVCVRCFGRSAWRA